MRISHLWQHHFVPIPDLSKLWHLRRLLYYMPGGDRMTNYKCIFLADTGEWGTVLFGK